MRFWIISLLGLLVQPGFAQSIDRQIIGSAGSSIENFTAHLSFTVGEPVTLSSTTGVKLTQGFQQVDQSELVFVPELLTDPLLSVYPVPTKSILMVKTKLIDHGATLYATVIDLQGKLVLQVELPISGGPLDVSALAPASYTLLLHDQERSYNQRVRFVKVR